MDDTHRPAKQRKGRASTLVLETQTSNGGWISKGLHHIEGIISFIEALANNKTLTKTYTTTTTNNNNAKHNKLIVLIEALAKNKTLDKNKLWHCFAWKITFTTTEASNNE